ncbi:MAG: NAD-dependent protein deacetylase [Myxococcales bacterium]|nr:NAD-dependent protein deacetylase [Myxococcales bacterium]
MEAHATDPRALDELIDILSDRPFVALTGAGCSTESGIPDYRSEGTIRRSRNPVRFQEYVRDEGARKRYWARSVIGWARMSAARPNPAHHALATLERLGPLRGVITQNVDRLHHAAGSRRVIELHGALAEVRCLACAALEPRAELQARLLARNPGWLRHAAELAPDGDATVSDAAVAHFEVVDCRACAGPLKPNVVFFGESVPRARVDAAYAMLAEARALLVVGSSLAVFSGYRFVKRAQDLGIPTAILNLGPTRGDPLAAVRVDGYAGALLPALARALAPG